MPNEIEMLIMDLYVKRRDHAMAKEAFRKLSSEVGRCSEVEAYGQGAAPCYSVMDPDLDGYLPPHLWCAACEKRQPLWEAKCAASLAAGAALRRVLSAGKRVFKDGHGEKCQN